MLAPAPMRALAWPASLGQELLGQTAATPMGGALGHLAPAPTQALAWGPAAAKPQARSPAPKQAWRHPPPVLRRALGCATANVTVWLAAEVQHAGQPSPNAKMDTRPAVPAMEEQAQVAAQKPLCCPPPKLQHPLGLPSHGRPKARCIGHNGLHSLVTLDKTEM
ncbi:UNVERIFIED_CONTAM: hypothetical protein K2H54_046937 [Gekko kuhli]